MHVSFRNRLTFFFILLVILPVLAVAVVGILIVRNTEEGQTDERLSLAQRAAEGLYRDAREGAQAVGADVRARTTRSRRPSARRPRRSSSARVDAARPTAPARRGSGSTLDGQGPIEAGDDDAIAPARSRLVGRRRARRARSSSRPPPRDDVRRRCSSGSAALDVLVTQGDGILGGDARGVGGGRSPSGETRRSTATSTASRRFGSAGLRGRRPRRPRAAARVARSSTAVSESTLGDRG